MKHAQRQQCCAQEEWSKCKHDVDDDCRMMMLMMMMMMMQLRFLFAKEALR
jgi:hypothetical protein